MPDLPSGSFLKAIQESSRTLRESAHISINHKSIERLLLSPAFTSSFKRVSGFHGLGLPLKFSSPLDELNLISVLSLLNFASGYRVPLHAQIGRGAWDTIRAFVFALYITSSSEGGDLLSARGIKNISNAKVAELLGVSVHTERPHESIPGLTVGELGGPMYELVELITGVLNQTGKILVDQGYPNFGVFVAECLKEGVTFRSSTDRNAELDAVLERLVRAIPAFQDMAEVNGQMVYCFKKALFLIHAIHIRFGSISPPPFPIPSTIGSPVFTDNVLPSMLIHLGVIDLSASPSLSSLFPGAGSEESLTKLLDVYESKPADNVPKLLPKEGPVLTLHQAFTLRGAAIDACESIIQAAHSLTPSHLLHGDDSLSWIQDITLPDLDMWIWAVAKDRADYRALERFVLRDTVFF